MKVILNACDVIFRLGINDPIRRGSLLLVGLDPTRGHEQRGARI
jgi:hypothetical protein